MEYPIALAPMGGSAGGALAGAVSRGGGLGLLGGGGGDEDWLARELPVLVDEAAGKPWGIGFLSWAVDVAVVARALEHGPTAMMLSFGDPGPFVEHIRSAGAVLIIQVTDLEEARRAVDLGADVIVAQGTESGGHGARHGRSTLPFVPVVVDLATPTPVLAAGGIADGRGVAAALALGADGALVGTRFHATPEALLAPETARAIVAGRGEDTERNSVLDIARSSRWPTKYTARTLGHPYLDGWRGREDELAAAPPGPTGLPGRRGTRRDPRTAPVGERGHRPHQRPAVRGRPGRNPGCTGRGRTVPSRQTLIGDQLGSRSADGRRVRCPAPLRH
ncbi:nitronate monooxygenase [Streptomyces sp. NPDC051080]|uniref:nitronate monooxygenase n=1 Tax=Streptomyces sp. NPDC051080 TaxID=3157222 RepID=UPI00343F70ED